MGYAELRFDEMVRELRENNQLLVRLIELVARIELLRRRKSEPPPGKEIAESGDCPLCWPMEPVGTNRQKTANTKNTEDEKSS